MRRSIIAEKLDELEAHVSNVEKHVSKLGNHTSHIWTWTRVNTWLIGIVLVVVLGGAVAILITALP